MIYFKVRKEYKLIPIPVVIVDAEQGTCEGEGLTVGDEDGGVDLAYRRSMEGEE